MSHTETKIVLEKLFGSQMEAARRLGYHERTVRYWCEFGAPPHVKQGLRDYASGLINLATLKLRLRRDRTRRASLDRVTA